MMRLVKTGAVLLAAALLLIGCSSTGDIKGEGAEGTAAGRGAGGPEIGKYGERPAGAYGEGGGRYGSGGQYGAEGAYGTSGRVGGASPEDPGGPLSKRVIYFLYDSSEVQPEYMSVINNHANYLAANPGRSVVLEGHADERGSPEYNVALGEQRAKTVAKLMKLQGVADKQILVVSFGEEKPAVPGYDESAWQQNRRVEISYPSR